MLIKVIIIILFLHYDLLSCHHYGKKNFNEDILMKRHHQNFLQINDFIKDAQHRFHEEKPLLGVRNEEYETTRDDKSLDRDATWWWDNSSFIAQLGLNTPQSLLYPFIRSRPSFPFSITPYTTELNDRHLKWDEIFPEQNANLHSAVVAVSYPQLNLSIPQSSSEPNSKGQNSAGPSSQPSILRNDSRQLLGNISFRSETSLSDNTGQGFNLTTVSITPNEDFMMRFREITMHTPVERWLQTLAEKIGVTPSYGHTTNLTTQVSRTPFKPHASVQNKHLENDFKDEQHSILHQGLPLSDDDYRTTAATTKAQFYILNVSGILHLKTVEDVRTTMVISGRPAAIPGDADKVATTTASDVLRRELATKTTGLYYSRKSRRFHSKARKRKRYHHSHKRKRTGWRDKHTYRHLNFSKDDRKQKQDVVYPMLRRMRESTEGSTRFSFNTQNLKGETKQKLRALFSNAVTRPAENTNVREPTYVPTPMSQFLSELNNIEDEEHVKFIEAQDELQYKNTAEIDKISVYDQVKESLKTAEKKEKDISLKVKAEQIRKLLTGSSSSYSDEEETLRRNLVEALRYGKRT